MRRYLLIIMVLVALLATGCGNSDVKTVTTPDGTKYKVNEEAIRSNVGFARSDEDGNLAPLDENDPDATAIAGVVMAWADLTGNRSWETITGDEEYHLYTDEMRAALINEDNDIENTRIGYIAHQTAAKAENIKATNIVLFSDTKAYAVVEADGTLLHSIDLESAARVGFDGIGSTKHDVAEFELGKDETGEWKISAFQVISDWAQVQ